MAIISVSIEYMFLIPLSISPEGGYYAERKSEIQSKDCWKGEIEYLTFLAWYRQFQ
jgi:hypothetical protein